MGDTAYHMEALRKARVIERKSEAMRKLKENFGQGGADTSGAREMCQAPLVYSEPGHFEQTRSRVVEKPMMISKDDVVFEEVVHDPNFKYRTLKDVGCAPIHVDPIYRIMYPGGQRK